MKGLVLGLAAMVVSILVLIVIAVLPAWNDSGTSVYYDDYIQDDNADHGDGIITEVKEVAGKRYVHIIGVGLGEYFTESGGSVKITSSKAPLDIIVAMGQSNNRYTCYDIAQISDWPELGTSYYWGNDFGLVAEPYGSAERSIEPLRDTETGAVKIADKVPIICAKWTEATGHKVLYICTAVGGSSITSWTPGDPVGTTHLSYQRQKIIINQVVSQIDKTHYDYNFAFCTWIQGEEDQHMDLDLYMGYFKDMFDALMSDSYPYQLNFMVMATPRLGTAVEADKLLADEYDNLYLATDIATTFTVTNGLLAPDDTHWTQKGDNITSEAMVKKALEVSHPDSDSNSVLPILIVIALTVAVAGVILGRRGYE